MELEGSEERFITRHTKCDCIDRYVYYKSYCKIGHNNHDKLLRCSDHAKTIKEQLVLVEDKEININTND